VRDGGQGCPRSEERDLIENAEFAELQAFVDHHEGPGWNGQKAREGEQERWAQFFRDHFVLVAAHSMNRLDLHFVVTSPGELDGRLSVGKPTHKVKHFQFCASWRHCDRSPAERRSFYFRKFRAVYFFRHSF
jgi:hypothetical protein